MKIAYVTASFPFGTGESFLISEISNLSEMSNELIVLPLHPRGKRRNDWMVPGDVTTLETGILSQEVILYFLMDVFYSPMKIFRTFAYLLKISKCNFLLFKNMVTIPKAVWLARKIAELGIDHIHVQWGGATATMGMLAAKISDCEWSFTCHRWDIYENNLLGPKSESAKFVRFISTRGLQDSLRFGVRKDRSIVISMGVSIGATPPILTCERIVPVILCAANFVEVKGHIYLIKAISILRERGLAVRLLLAGDGPLKSSLFDFVNAHDLSNSVEFLGNVNHDYLLDKYRNKQVDIFVLPSVDLGNGHHEGVPVSLMEAMSFGIPVISTKTGSIEELLDSTIGLTVPDKDPVALADKISHFIVDPGRYSEVSRIVGEVISANWNANISASRLNRMLILS